MIVNPPMIASGYVYGIGLRDRFKSGKSCNCYEIVAGVFARLEANDWKISTGLP
ncbi:hypothetical protein [Euhalothece natronophila]|uniref:hypothetical protein n=1 Tax=Euhalothece natronophila TaxID=577489 RepID=UPI001648349B|nr:hypothetical protein [Euhalothece natronophila]